MGGLNDGQAFYKTRTTGWELFNAFGEHGTLLSTDGGGGRTDQREEGVLTEGDAICKVMSPYDMLRLCLEDPAVRSWRTTSSHAGNRRVG